jgi:hypothetical protein
MVLGRTRTILFIVYLISYITSQFYFSASGSLQLSNYLQLIVFLFIYLIDGIRVSVVKTFPFRLATFFTVYTILINGLFSLIYSDVSFLTSSLYFVFGLILFYTTLYFSQFILEFNRFLLVSSTCALLLLFILWVLGYGNYYNFPRFNGFFNDPNQMAHWCLCLCTIPLLHEKGKVSSSSILLVVISSFLISLTMSRSAFVSVCLMLVYQLFFLRSNPKSILFLLIVLIAVIFYLQVDGFYLDNLLFYIDRVQSTDINDQVDVRGYTRLLDYPEYLLFGAGQALDERFNSVFEIHSTWAGILFYYGIFGLYIFISIIITIIKKMKSSQGILFAIPLLYGFSTFSVRTPIFWFFLGVAASQYFKYEKN